MLKLPKLVITLLLLMGAYPLLSAQPRVVLVLGDSLSSGYGISAEAGWVNLLRQRVNQRDTAWQIINASVSGETTIGGLNRLPALLQRHRPEIVVIELGSNDGLRGLSFRRMRENLMTMVNAVELAGGEAIMVGGRLPPNYGNAFTEAFVQVFVAIADEKGVPLVPFLLEGIAQDLSLMQADGYHPTAEAQLRLLENVWPTLEPLILKGVGDK